MSVPRFLIWRLYLDHLWKPILRIKSIQGSDNISMWSLCIQRAMAVNFEEKMNNVNSDSNLYWFSFRYVHFMSCSTWNTFSTCFSYRFRMRIKQSSSGSKPRRAVAEFRKEALTTSELNAGRSNFVPVERLRACATKPDLFRVHRRYPVKCREGRGYQLIVDPFVIIGAQRSPGPRADSIETFHVERCLIWRWWMFHGLMDIKAAAGSRRFWNRNVPERFRWRFVIYTLVTCG